MGHAAHAQPVFDIPQNTTSVPLSQELEYFVDESGQWQPESGTPVPGEWQKLGDRAGTGNFGYRVHPVWFRVVLRSSTASEWVWAVSTPTLDSVAWVQWRPGSEPERSEAGLGRMHERLVAISRLPTVKLTLAANEPVLVYMRVQSSGLMSVPVDLWEPLAWQERQRRVHVLLGAYFGLVAGLLAYNGFLALRLRDPAYGFYLCFGLGLSVFQLASTGFGPGFLWASHALWTNTIQGMSVTVFGAFTMLFTDSFLRLSRSSPRLHRMLTAITIAWAIAFVLHAWLPSQTVKAWISAPLAVLTCTLVMIAGVRGYLNQTPGASYFLLGWAGLVVAALLRALLPLSDLPPHPLLYDGLLIASAAEMLLLSLALADRIMMERRARAEADVQRAREQVAREEAQRALQEKSRFMASVAHDLQQPIYALSLATESMARRRADVVSIEALNQMQSAVFAADELLSSLAMLVRLDRADLKPDIGDFCIQPLLEQMSELFGPLAQQRGLDWRVTPSVAMVCSDPKLLARMVSNLVSNAMRYTQRGGVLLSCRLRSDHLLIQVWDTGRGIHPDEQAAVFEMHYRGTEASADEQGSGLGLSIVQRCASLLDIRVSLRSVPGRGSCFSLQVPLCSPGQTASA